MKKMNMTLGTIFLAATLSLTGYAKDINKRGANATCFN